MNYGVFFRQALRSLLWDVLLAIFFGGIIFAVLIITTGGLLVSLATALVVMLVFGVFHYVIWGQGLMKRVAPERAREETRAGLPDGPKEEFVLNLDERERKVLIDALEQSLAAPGETRQPGIIREVLNRLRGFGV